MPSTRIIAARSRILCYRRIYFGMKKKWFSYAFPHFSDILRVLRKIKLERANGIVVVPYWKAQPWFPLFLSSIEAEPNSFHPNMNLIRSSSREPHPVWHRLTLVAAKLSGKPMFLWNRWIFLLVPYRSRPFVSITVVKKKKKKKWWAFCRINTVGPFAASINDVLTFLTKEFRMEASCSSLNC